MSSGPVSNDRPTTNRRGFLASGAIAAAAISVIPSTSSIAATETPKLVVPPVGKRILISCKLSMIANEESGKKLSLVERLRMAGEAGFDGVDFDEAGTVTVETSQRRLFRSQECSRTTPSIMITGIAA